MTLKKSDAVTNSNDYRLSVQVSLTGLSFLMANSDKSEVLFYKVKSFETDYNPNEILEEIKTILSEIDALEIKVGNVTIIYATGINTLIPKSLFDQSKASEYLKFNSKILANDFIANDTMNALGIINVYVPLINVNNYFFDRYGGFSYYHATTILLKNILNDNRLEGKNVFINFQKDMVDVVMVENRNLLLSNNFIFKTSEDLIYYILFTFEQLCLDPEKIHVKLLGSINEDDSNYKILYKYIRNISFYKASTSKIDIAGIEDHQNLILKYIA